MKNTHPIIIVDDDPDDCELIRHALTSIGVKNEQKCFSNGEDALNYLMTTTDQTFLILSDINMPRLNGLELKRAINTNSELKNKSIPFVFLSTSVVEVNQAYDLLAQGFFQKPSKLEDIMELLHMITKYWDFCQQPR